MNKIRYAEIKRLQGDLDDIQSVCEAWRDEEQGYLDNMPENLWCGEHATEAENTVSGLDSVIDYLDYVCNSLAEIETLVKIKGGK